MKLFLFQLFLLVTSLSATSQIFTKGNDESKIDFIKKNAPVGLSFCEELGNQMIETREWSVEPSIIGFYTLTHKLPNGEIDYKDVLGYLYVPIGSKKYKRVFIDTFENEGGYAQIISIFHANADSDTSRELGVIIRWQEKHYEISGIFYETRLYDNLQQGAIASKLTYLKKISEKVSGGFDGYQKGKTLLSKFKTAKEVKARLKKLGY